MNDLVYVWRQALAKPLFAGLIVGVLALGIGATTAIFSLTDAVLFRPLAVAEPARVFRIFRVDEAGNPNNNLAFTSYSDLRDNASSFSHIAAYQDWAPFNLAAAGQAPLRVSGAVVTGDYFNLFGVSPLLGRYLLPSDDVDRGGHPVVVISESLWRRQFGATPDILGTQVTINTHPFTVIGVMPAAFGGPDAQPSVEAWAPMAMLEQAAAFEEWSFLTNRGVTWLDGVARLAPGVTYAQASAEVDSIVAGVVEQTGENLDDMQLGLFPAAEVAVDAYGNQGAARNALLLLGVTATLLLIAVTNAASLLLVRTDERSRELALRLGIGAPRSRVLRMLLIEALAYAALGAALGLLLAFIVLSASLDALGGMLPAVPRDPALLLHWRVIALAVAVASATALVAVISPGLRVLRLDVSSSLKQGAARAPRSSARARGVLVAGQVALSVALLAVALLLVRSFWNTAIVDPGFDPRNTLVASVDLLRQGYTPEQAGQFQEQLVSRLAEHPAVDSATFARIVPVANGGMVSTFSRPGIEQTSPAPRTDINLVSPSFFETMRIPLLQGRAIEAGDREGAPRALVVNRAFADQHLTGEDPLGQRITFSRHDWTIVGVTADIKVRDMRESPRPLAWMSLAQRPDAQASIVIRGTEPDPLVLVPVLREVAATLDPNLPLFRVRTLADHVGASYSQATVMAWILGAFATLAVVLSAAGLYGLLSWQVRTRTREIGVRLAIGASAQAIQRQFLRRGLVLTALGIPFGLLAAAWVARALDELLYGVDAYDATNAFTVVVGFLTLALLATWGPARRSSRVSPMEALRDE